MFLLLKKKKKKQNRYSYTYGAYKILKSFYTKSISYKNGICSRVFTYIVRHICVTCFNYFFMAVFFLSVALKTFSVVIHKMKILFYI